MPRKLVVTVAAIAFLQGSPASARQLASSAPVLKLEDALALASTDQPRIEAYQREADASAESAVAARTLPDPELMTGIQNFPITGHDALSPTADEMTMFMIGITRKQVRRSKREADAQKILAEALVSKRQASAEERRIRRDVMLAWLDTVEALAKEKLLQTLIADLKTGRQIAVAGIPTGGSTPALALQADADIALEESDLADAQRAEARARAELGRWIGPAAERPLPDALPHIELPADYAGRLTAIGVHPEVQVARAEQDVATREVEAARQDRRPDFSWSLSLGVRPRYGEMVTGTVSIPLQVNRSNRQDRLVSAAQDRADAANLRLQDAARELQSNYLGAVADYRGADAEIARIDKEAVPALESAFKVAEARYEAGGGTLDQSFAIVRRYEETAIQSIEAHGRRERAAASILYVLGEAGK